MAIRIRCFPSTDRDFFDAVHAAAGDLNPSSAVSSDAVRAVEQALAERYPQIRISVRSGLAVLWSDEPHWYAYRDGRPDARGPGAALRRGQGALRRAIRSAKRGKTAA
jgi:hypothetical protein